MAISWRHQPSPWPAAAWAAGRWNRLSTRALCLAVNQNRKYKVFLGSSEYLLVSDEFLYIYIRLVWFQCKVTILFTVFKLAHLTCSQRTAVVTKYSMHILPLLPPHPQEGIWSKQNKMNISRTCNTELQRAQQTAQKMYPWCMLPMVMGDFPLLY